MAVIDNMAATGVGTYSNPLKKFKYVFNVMGMVLWLNVVANVWQVGVFGRTEWYGHPTSSAIVLSRCFFG